MIISMMMLHLTAIVLVVLMLDRMSFIGGIDKLSLFGIMWRHLLRILLLMK